MKKVDGLYWDEKPDWQHDKWQFKQLIKECRIFNKMAKDREWVISIAKDMQEIALTLEDKNNISSAICDIALHKEAIYYYKIAESMYEIKNKEQE